ncbi:hypothetical protein [Nocardia sp. NPDC006630]|uniref:hypothetical protein n=1 Tax=Nocardia sp. NPDC006630 TaxID=3157181 RepID=UPI0033B43ED7
MYRLTAFAGVFVALTAIGGVTGGVAAAGPVGYDTCGESAYVTGLYTDLAHNNPPADRAGAVTRAQGFRDNAPAELAGDAAIEAEAETAVLGGASVDVLQNDPVIQAWGDVMDWHTGHCL